MSQIDRLNQLRQARSRLLFDALAHAHHRAEREQKAMLVYVGERVYVRAEDEPEPEEDGIYDQFRIEPGESCHQVTKDRVLDALKAMREERDGRS